MLTTVLASVAIVYVCLPILICLGFILYYRSSIHREYQTVASESDDDEKECEYQGQQEVEHELEDGFGRKRDSGSEEH